MNKIGDTNVSVEPLLLSRSKSLYSTQLTCFMVTNHDDKKKCVRITDAYDKYQVICIDPKAAVVTRAYQLPIQIETNIYKSKET